MKARMVLALLLLVLAAACGSGTEPDTQFLLSFNVVPADTIMEGDTVIFTREAYGRFQDLRPITAAGEPSKIVVLGSFVSSCNAPPLGSSQRSVDELVLTISFPPSDLIGCASVPGPYTYEARFTQVPPGSYRLVVQHQGDQLRADGVVFEQQVEVP